MVYILDSLALNISTKVELDAVPSFMSVLGLYQDDEEDEDDEEDDEQQRGMTRACQMAVAAAMRRDKAAMTREVMEQYKQSECVQVGNQWRARTTSVSATSAAAQSAECLAGQQEKGRFAAYLCRAQC